MPLRDHPNIIIGHGGGGKLSAELVEHLFMPAFSNPVLTNLSGAARAIHQRRAPRLLHRHIYDCARLSFQRQHQRAGRQRHGERHRHVRGHAAFPQHWLHSRRRMDLSLLGAIAQSMGEAAAAVSVSIVAGDTEVVDKVTATASPSAHAASA